MQVTETNNEGLKRAYKIVVPAADIEEKINARLTQIAQTANMPGFRPGKVPVSLLKKQHGQAIMGEILEMTVSESSQATIVEKELRPVAQPKIEIDKFDEGGDLEYSIELEVFPDIELTDFSKLKLERKKVPANEDQVEEIIGQMADGQKDSKPIEKNRPIATGDVAVIDFTGSVDGEEFAGGKAEDYGLEIGSGSFIPGFEEQIIGKEVGNEFDVSVTFPDQYAEELAGKDAVFAVKIKELRETTPATLDDAFAQKMGAENLEDLKDKLRENQEAELAQYTRMRVKRDLLDVLDDVHEFELPGGMIESEFEAVWHQFEHQRKEHPDQIDEDDKGKTDDELKEEYRDISARRVRLGLLLAEIGRINEITVTPDEVNRAIMQEAQQYKGQEKEVFEYYKNNPEAMQAVQSPLLEDKVVDYILELANVSEKVVTIEELMAEPEEAKPAKKAKSTTKKKAPAKKKAAAKKKVAAKKGDD
ncbi:MAG: trigger factor [Rhodospirillaceae bacterium]|jgi:trigger factor|nr:trigger factor [Rhodospirillaceae bacterium]MBT4589327.1 trigger factor [Rhodospirillaceae bacterium]MBT5938708.1 trigger factor [Rhodospirillaceae bacterium]MBT7266742.1 trigger factor [Rhodospirillaceae bacterium]